MPEKKRLFKALATVFMVAGICWKKFAGTGCWKRYFVPVFHRQNPSFSTGQK